MNLVKISIFILLLLPTALAQADVEATTGILRGLLGDLPTPCSDITSSVCIYCLGYVKLLPLAFFFGLFYFILAYGVRYFVKSENPTAIPSVRAGVALISIALAFFTLQSGAVGGALSRIATFTDWINGLLILIWVVIGAIFLSRISNAIRFTEGVGHAPGVGANPRWMLILVIAGLVLMGFLWLSVASFSTGELNPLTAIADVNPWFTILILGILASMFATFFFHGPMQNLATILLIVLYFLLFAALRGALPGVEGVLPELLKESPNFPLGICQ